MLAIEIRPSDDLQDRIDAMLNQCSSLKGDVSAIVRESSIAVVAGAKNYVPVSTGGLRRSLMAIFLNSGMSSILGSWLPYAAKQNFDETLDHSPRPSRIRVRNTKAGIAGSVIKGTNQSNPNAQAHFLDQALEDEKPNFLDRLQGLVDKFEMAWTGT